MEFPPPGHFRSAAAFRAHLHQLGAGFDLDDSVVAGGPLGVPLPLPFGTAANRFATQPMEGWDATADGRPTDAVRRRWRRFGQSGAGLVFGGEAFAVRPDGRANPHQLCLGPHSEADLRELRDEVQRGAAERGGLLPVLGLQLTHSGRFARPHGPFAPKLAQHHPLLARKYGLPEDLPLLSDGELEAIGEAFVAAATAAWRAGFAFVDVKCCHGYLLHELLAAKTRPGTYGGSFEHRVRLFERIVAGIRRDCPGLGLAVRLSAGDTVPFQRGADGRGEPMPGQGFAFDQHHFGIRRDDPTGLDLAEPLQFLRRAQGLGIGLANLTLGSPYWNPHLQRPAAYPPSDGYLPPADPLRFVALHLAVARTVAQALPGLPLVGTGYTYLQEWLPHVAQHAVRSGHVHLIGLGRLVLSYPELPHDVLAGRPLQRKQICRTFSDCTTAPRNGLPSGCYPLDPYYRDRPEAEQVKALAKRARAGGAPS